MIAAWREALPGRLRSERDCRRLLRQMSDVDRQAALAAIPLYVAQPVPAGKQPHNLLTFLDGRVYDRFRPANPVRASPKAIRDLAHLAELKQTTDFRPAEWANGVELVALAAREPETWRQAVDQWMQHYRESQPAT